jgi:hypothetical protein
MQIITPAFIFTLVILSSCKNSIQPTWRDLPEMTNIGKFKQMEFVPMWLDGGIRLFNIGGPGIYFIEDC